MADIDAAVERKRLAARMRALAAWISGTGKGAHLDLKCGPTADDLLTVAGMLDGAELEARVPQGEPEVTRVKAAARALLDDIENGKPLAQATQAEVSRTLALIENLRALVIDAPQPAQAPADDPRADEIGKQQGPSRDW